jgi:hypothetical protein
MDYVELAVCDRVVGKLKTTQDPLRLRIRRRAKTFQETEDFVAMPREGDISLPTLPVPTQWALLKYAEIIFSLQLRP